MNISEMRIVLCFGMHNHLKFFIKRFAEYLSAQDIVYYLFNCDKYEDSAYGLREFVTNNLNVVMFTYNNIGVGLYDEVGQNFWKKHGITVFDFIQDHPRNYPDTLLNPPCNIVAIAIDRNHEEYIRRHYPLVKDVFFATNGGTESKTPIQYKDRKYDVIYMGSCLNPGDRFPKIEFMEDGGAEFYQCCVSTLFYNSGLTTEEVFDLYFENKGISLSDEKRRQINEKCGYAVEGMVRYQTRMEAIKALDNAGIQVDIWGEWNSEGFSDNVTIHDYVLPEELLDIAGNAKIALCATPWYKRGCSEKQMDALLCGCVCVTDTSEYLLENYNDGESIVFFDFENLDQLVADILWLLEHEDAAEAIAKSGYNTALIKDTWERRYEKILARMYSDVCSDGAIYRLER